MKDSKFYKLLKSELGCTLIFLRPDGSEHIHRWDFSTEEFNETADRAAAACFPDAYELSCAHARGDAHTLAKPDDSALCLTSYIFFKSSDAPRVSHHRLEVRRIGLAYRVFVVRAHLGFNFLESNFPMREDYDDQGRYSSLSEAALALCSFLNDFHRDERAAREDAREWQLEQDQISQ